MSVHENYCTTETAKRLRDDFLALERRGREAGLKWPRGGFEWLIGIPSNPDGITAAILGVRPRHVLLLATSAFRAPVGTPADANVLANIAAMTAWWGAHGRTLVGHDVEFHLVGGRRPGCARNPGAARRAGVRDQRCEPMCRGRFQRPNGTQGRSVALRRTPRHVAGEVRARVPGGQGGGGYHPPRSRPATVGCDGAPMRTAWRGRRFAPVSSAAPGPSSKRSRRCGMGSTHGPSPSGVMRWPPVMPCVFRTSRATSAHSTRRCVNCRRATCSRSASPR
jgi:hypothetical protein